MNGKIPVTVLVMTRNEAPRIGRCLAALTAFDEVIVADSGSADATPDIAQQMGARVIPFQWNGRYPKKRQWCLDNLPLKHDWVFMVDADEEITSALIAEISSLFAENPSPSRLRGSLPLPEGRGDRDGYASPLSLQGEGRGEGLLHAGYFIKGRYVLRGKTLHFGLRNNKLALFDRRQIMFPVIDDADIPGMGEIEGHYQPVLKPAFRDRPIGQIKHALLHYAYDDQAGWEFRHRRYALWEAAMINRNAWPADPVPAREHLKRLFRRLPGRGVIAFLHSYIFKLGFLDGARGFSFARDRWRYYRMVAAALRA